MTSRPAPQKLSDQETQEVMEWVDGVPLSKPKRSLGRDFADGLLTAEVVHHFLPKLVELHNYSASNNSQTKKYTWQTLNAKVLKKLNIDLDAQRIDALCSAAPGAAELFLWELRARITETLRVAEEARLRKMQQGGGVGAGSPGGGSGSGGTQGQLQGGYTIEQLVVIMRKKDEAIAELVAQVDALQRRVVHLEELLQIKDKKLSRVTP